MTSIQSAEMGKLKKSESGVAITDKLNRGDAASGKSAFRTPVKLHQSRAGTQLMDGSQLLYSGRILESRQRASEQPTSRTQVQSLQFSPLASSQKARQQSVFIDQSGQQSQSRQQATRSDYFNWRAWQETQLRTFYIQSKKLDFDAPQTTKNMSSLSQPVDKRSPEPQSQKGKRIQSMFQQKSESEHKHVDTRQYLLSIAQQNNSVLAGGLSASPQIKKHFPNISHPKVSNSALISRSEARNKQKQANGMSPPQSQDPIHTLTVKKHMHDHSRLPPPTATGTSQALDDCFSSELQQSRQQALQQIQNLIFETSCNPNQMHSIKAKQQAQIYQFLSAKEGFFNVSNKPRASSITPKFQSKGNDIDHGRKNYRAKQQMTTLEKVERQMRQNEF